MASLTLTVSDVVKVNGRVYVRWSDGVEIDFNSLQHAKDYANLSDDLANILRRLGIARYLALDPNGTNPALIKGHSITVTDASNSMVVVT